MSDNSAQSNAAGDHRLTAITWNVGHQSADSVRAYAARHTPEVLCLQETGLSPPEVDNYTVAVATRQRYAGVAIYVRQDSEKEDGDGKPPLLVPSNPGVWVGGRVVKCEVAGVVFVGVYARNDYFKRGAAAAREQDDSTLRERLVEARAARRRVVMLGDMNLCLCFGDHHSHVGKAFDPHRAATAKVVRWRQLLDSGGLVDVGGQGSPWTFQSRIGKARGGRYDYVFATPGVCSGYAVDCDACQKDHMPITVRVRVPATGESIKKE